MVALQIKDLEKKVNNRFAPFEVQYGEGSDEVVAFCHPLKAEAKARNDFYAAITKIQVLTSTEITEEQKIEFFGEDTEQITNDPIGYAVSIIKAALKAFADDKRKYASLVKVLGNDYPMWDEVFGSFMEHFEARESQGESQPSQTS